MLLNQKTGNLLERYDDYQKDIKWAVECPETLLLPADYANADAERHNVI
jgi:hypothetical protein